MNYSIKREVDERYLHSYFYQSKNECSQIIRCEFYETVGPSNHFNFSFCIKQKRKWNFPDGEITGKDGIKSLVWAYRCLLDCIDFLEWRYPHSTLHIYGDTRRKQKIYNRYLLPLGFKITQDKFKELVLKFE